MSLKVKNYFAAKEAKEALEHVQEFKERGLKVVKQDFKAAWCNKVDLRMLNGSDKSIAYYAYTIKKALECMELLSSGTSVERVYKFMSAEKRKWVYFDARMTPLQEYNIACIIGVFHERGKEFCDYRNAMIS